MATKLIRLTQNSNTTAPSGRALHHLQFSLQEASPGTFGYTLIATYLQLTERDHLLIIILEQLRT